MKPKSSGGTHSSPMRFVITFVVLLVVFELLFEFVIAPSDLFRSYLALNARLSGAILSIFEHGVVTEGTVIRSARNTLGIARGCDALQPMGIFLAAVIAFPAAWRSKAAPMILGALLLLAVNQLRIVSLYYLGLETPTVFEVFHEAVWPAAFILLAFGMWLAWVKRLGRTAASA